MDPCTLHYREITALTIFVRDIYCIQSRIKYAERYYLAVPQPRPWVGVQPIPLAAFPQ